MADEDNKRIIGQIALREKMREIALQPFLDGYNYNPGDDDLDNEQPISIRVTLGDYRRLRSIIRHVAK